MVPHHDEDQLQAARKLIGKMRAEIAAFNDTAARLGVRIDIPVLWYKTDNGVWGIDRIAHPDLQPFG
jgi:hypothetical protein